jgi:predicted membrane channel-forming protein YqfA (hemolysin III family)
MKLNSGVIEGMIYTVILIIILFSVAAALIPVAQTSGDTLCTSGVPLGSLFKGTGVVFYIIMGAILLLLVKSLMGSGKK